MSAPEIVKQITIHRTYSVTGPGGSFLVVLGWTKDTVSSKRWEVSIWRQDLRKTRLSWLPFVRPRLIHTLVTRELNIRRLVYAREAFEPAQLTAEQMARGHHSEVNAPLLPMAEQAVEV
jgi:hypothetical protein